MKVSQQERNRRAGEGQRLRWTMRKVGPWSYKIRKGKNQGESVILVFRTSEGRNDELFVSRWYPPWQNSLMRANANLMVSDLNAAFLARRKADDEQETA